MRKFLAVLLIVPALTFSGLAQEGHPAAPAKPTEPQELSKVSAFMKTRGILISRTYFTAGSVRNLKVEGLVAENLVGGGKYKGLSLTLNDATSLLDVDEAKALSLALSKMVDVMAKWSAESTTAHVEVEFVGHDNLAVQAFTTTSGPRAILLVGTVEEDHMTMDPEEMKTFKVAIDAALIQLSQK